MLVVALGCLGCASLIEVIPPDAMTRNAVTETRVRIGMYLERNTVLPPSLEVLPMRDKYMNRTTDAWDRPLIYQIDDDGFSLTSLGKDGAPGGSGLDADVTEKYRIVDGELEAVR
jgi:hypothetical protein